MKGWKKQVSNQTWFRSRPTLSLWGGLSAFLLFLLLCTGQAGAAGDAVRINADQLLYDDIQEEIRAKGGVSVRWSDGEITTEEVVFLLATSELYVPGPVLARLGNHQVSGEGLYYNFITNSGWFEQSELVYRVSEGGDLYFRGARIEVSGDEWRGDDLQVTGCCADTPFYSIRAQSVTIYPQERLVIEGLSLYVRENRVFWIPAWSGRLGGSETRLVPNIGYSITRGYFVDFTYQYPLTRELIFQAQLNLATKKETRLGADLIGTFSHLETRVFYDYWYDDDPGFGGYVRFLNDSLSLWLISYENERIEQERLTRSPQFVASYRDDFGEGFYGGADLSFGHFTSGEVSTWREDLYFLAGWSRDGLGIELFYQSIALDALPDAQAFGGVVWAEKDFSDEFSAGIRYRYTSVTGDTFFFFDPAAKNELQLDLTYGNLDRSFLRLRGLYDLTEGAFDTVIAGVGLGINDVSFGVEGMYSLPSDDWQKTRYFVRRKIEECVTIEASWLEPDQTFYFSVDLAGFTQPRSGETLFDEEEPYHIFGVER